MPSDLFVDDSQCLSLALPNAQIDVLPSFIDSAQADQLFNVLYQQLDWTQQHIKVYGKEYAVPRLSAWYADAGRCYEYSGLRMKGLPWTSALKEIKAQVEDYCQQYFNSMLANLYRDGADAVGWHADDEDELGKNPFIASLSLGQPRHFQLKHRRDKRLTKSFLLPHGSLLIMQGETQHHWLHQIPKSRKAMLPRINLSFRQLK